MNDTLEKEFERISNKVMGDNPENMSKAYQKIAQVCGFNADDAVMFPVVEFWEKKKESMLELARGLSQVIKVTESQNTDEFKTEFKFASKEERTLFQRFVEGGRSSGNKYMFYTVVDRNYNYRTEDFQYFTELNEIIKERFDEITNYEYIITDKRYLVNNEIQAETSIGKRYIYYVDAEDFADSSKNNPLEHSVLSKPFRFAKVFKSYEALLEHLETNVKNKAIYVIGENAFNGLRYVIDSIEMVMMPNQIKDFDIPLIRHDFQKYGNFLSFKKRTEDSFINREIVTEEIEVKENFSNHIRFAKSSKKTKDVEKDIDYKLIKLTKAGLKPQIFRWARKAKKNDFSRFIQIKNILIELDEKLKMVGTEIYPEGHIKNDGNFINTGNVLSGLSFTQKDMQTQNSDLLDELSTIIPIQIIG